jgi:hypothetical protein
MVYLRYAFVPLLWVALPLAMLASHLQARYGYDGLHPGHGAMVTVRMKPAAGVEAGGAVAARPNITLDAPPDLRVETPGVWAAPLREMAWRISARGDGDYELRISSHSTGPAANATAAGAAAAVTKRVLFTNRALARPVTKPSPSLWDQLWNPAEAPLPADSPIEAIDITYPELAFVMFGFPLHWLAVFVILSTLFAFLLRPVFKVVL